MNTAQGHLTVRAALGDSLLEVQRASTYPLRMEGITDYDLVGRDEELQFVFAGPRPFDLPPTRYLALECTAALVTRIKTSPHLEYLAQDEALKLADELAARCAAAGWLPVPTDRRLTGRGELALRLRDPARRDGMRWYLGAFESSSARLDIVLRLGRRAGSFAAHDLYLLNIEIDDDELQRRAYEAMKALQRADGLSADGPRRIVLETYVPRVRQLVPR